MRLSRAECERQAQVRYALGRIYVSRRMKNPSYSLRAFARQLGVNKTSLLDFLNGKRCVSSKILDAIERRALSGTTAMM